MKPLIVANWKCNPTTQEEAEKLFNSIRNGLKEIPNVETVVCSPFVYLPLLDTKSSEIKIGAQDCFWEKSGAFTGGTSPAMLKDLGCQYVILGHSERRIHFGDTDEIVNKKIRAAISEELMPVFCFGETEAERKMGGTERILERQIKKGLNGILEKEMESIVIAYEPVWAIGTGNPCEPAETAKIVSSIRSIISKIYSEQIAQGLRILYGGSINSQNAKNYILESGVMGFVIGGASLKSEEFIKIVKIVSRA